MPGNAYFDDRLLEALAASVARDDDVVLSPAVSYQAGGSRKGPYSEKLWRLLTILTLVQGGQRVRARDLAEHCEVTERTIYRDIEALTAAGIPIYFDQDGYRLTDGFLLKPLHLSVPEAVALTVAANTLMKQEGTHYRVAAQGALDKINAVLPEGARRLADEAGSRIRIDLRAFQAPSARDDILEVLEQAVFHRQRCQMTYFSLNRGEVTERKVDPYGLLFRERAWYLVAYCHRRSEVVLFRTDRIRKIQPLDEAFVIPEGFSLDDYMANAWEVERGQEVTVTIRFSAAAAPLIREAKWHASQALRELPDGSLEMTVTTGGRHALMRWVLGFAGEAVVVAPEEIRREVAEMAGKAARANGAGQ